MISWQRIVWVAKKEMRQVWRNPTLRNLLFGPPVLQLLLFGYATNTDLRDVPTAVLDQDQSAQSRAVVSRLRGSPYFTITRNLRTEDEAARLLDRGDVLLVIHVKDRFGSDLDRGQPASVQLLLDGTDSNRALVALSYAQQALTPTISDLPGLPLSGVPVQLSPRVWYNESLVSRIFFVPGVVALITLLVSLMMTSMSVVREREIGTLEQLLVTPLRPLEFMLGKAIPFGIIVAGDLLFVTIVAILLFQVPVRGSVILLAASMLIFMMASLGIGLLASTASHTQQQAMMMSFVIMFPLTLLSGLAFPIRNMPPIIQYVTYANPMRYILVIVRGVLLKGVGLTILYPEVLALAGLTIVIMGAAVLRFRRRLD